MENGTVLWFNEDTGKGRIAPDKGNDTLIATSDSFKKEEINIPKRGQRVSFRTAHGPTGLHAIDIGILGKD